MVFDIATGAKVQRLRRDDQNYHADHVGWAAPGYRVGSDDFMGFMILGVKTKMEKWHDISYSGKPSLGAGLYTQIHEAGPAPFEVADCWVMLGNLYRARGANTTESERRTVH